MELPRTIQDLICAKKKHKSIGESTKWKGLACFINQLFYLRAAVIPTQGLPVSFISPDITDR